MAGTNCNKKYKKLEEEVRRNESEIHKNPEQMLNEVIEKLIETKMQNRDNRLTFMDTSSAWSVLKNLHKEKLENEHSHQDSVSSNFQSLQDLTECHVDTSNDYEAVLPEHAQYNYIYYEPITRSKYCTICRNEINIMQNSRCGWHVCRICSGTFHADCLIKRGFCNDDLSRETLEESTSDVGWSCPDCESLFSLLETPEQEEITEIFTRVAGIDGVIDRIEFLQLQKKEYLRLVGIPMPVCREKQEEELFCKIDRNHTGAIDHWEFLPYMAVRFLSRRSSKELLNLLTPKEILNFKEFFKEQDKENIGCITRSLAKRAYINWYKSKVKHSPSNYIDYEWYGGLKENPLLQSLRKALSINEPEDGETVGQDKDTSNIEWIDYLKQCCIHILAARENTGSQKPLIPPMPSVLYANDAESKNIKNKGKDDFMRMCQEAMELTHLLNKKGFRS